MSNPRLSLAACAILPVLAIFGSMPGAWADPLVDGTISPGEYGAPTATVGYDPNAQVSNFQNPGNTATVGYSIYMTDVNGYLYGALQTNGSLGGNSALNFANLYFDLDPQNNNGSDLGFELGPNGAMAFIPGVNGSVALSGVQYANGTGGYVIEFAIPNIDFEQPIAGLNYYPGQVFPGGANPDVVLRLSQSFGYSVAGGSLYGPDRLGEVGLQDVAVPEPAAAGMLVLAIGMLGVVRRRGNRQLSVKQ